MVITVSRRWFSTSQRDCTRPTCGLLAIGRAASTVSRTDSVSPANTGLSQRRLSMPGEPRLAAFSRYSSHIMRIASALVCQPLAHRPPKSDWRAASSSTWKGCGS